MLSPANHFDCETVSLMGRVCDEAWLDLRDKLFFPSLIEEQSVRTVLAFRVLVAVSQGERNANRLKSIALTAVDE